MMCLSLLHSFRGCVHGLLPQPAGIELDGLAGRQATGIPSLTHPRNAVFIPLSNLITNRTSPPLAHPHFSFGCCADALSLFRTLYIHTHKHTQTQHWEMEVIPAVSFKIYLFHNNYSHKN